MTPIQKLLAAFVSDLDAIIADRINARLHDVYRIGLATTPHGKRPAAVLPGRTKDGRRKCPPQYCPVPRCRGLAAPIYGMVCGDHRHVPKATIAKYRDARRGKKRAA